MASGIVRKAMVYLGLTDDEFEDFEGYDEGGSPPPRRQPEAAETNSGQVSAVRPLGRDATDVSNGVTVTPRPAIVRPITPMQSAKVHVVAPGQVRGRPGDRGSLQKRPAGHRQPSGQ